MERGQIVALVNPWEREAKAWAALELGRILAAGGLRVLLVDCADEPALTRRALGAPPPPDPDAPREPTRFGAPLLPQARPLAPRLDLLPGDTYPLPWAEAATLAHLLLEGALRRAHDYDVALLLAEHAIVVCRTGDAAARQIPPYAPGEYHPYGLYPATPVAAVTVGRWARPPQSAPYRAAVAAALPDAAYIHIPLDPAPARAAGETGLPPRAASGELGVLAEHVAALVGRAHRLARR